CARTTSSLEVSLDVW
nr:immunoglobulin heavy chain junction region [Macaca mulatta]